MSDQRDISIWFHSEIWRPRLAFVIGLQSIATMLTTFCALALLQLNLFHPITSVSRFVMVPFSWKCCAVSFGTGLITIPSTLAASLILSPRDQNFFALISQNGWRFSTCVFAWTTLQTIVDLTVALCLKFFVVEPNAWGVVCCGTVVASWSSVSLYFMRRRYCLDFPVDFESKKYRKWLVCFYEKIYRSNVKDAAMFIGYAVGLFVVTFIVFGWRISRFFSGYPATFFDALWHVVLCQPSVTWAVAVLALGTIIRQNSVTSLFNLLLCEARFLKHLMDEGADVNAADSLGKTALMHAATLGARSAVDAILSSGRVDAARADLFGNTALILASSAGHDAVVGLLLEHLKKTMSPEDARLHVTARNKNGDTALTVAQSGGNEDCVLVLREYLRPVQFILQSSDLPPVNRDNDVFYTLAEALSVEKPPLLKYLAFLDLRLLTYQRQPRMQRIFTVSRPGGHARSWLSIASPMLRALQNQIKLFHDTNERLAAAWERRIEQATAGRGLVAGQGRVPLTMQPKHWNREWTLQQSGGPSAAAAFASSGNRNGQDRAHSAAAAKLSAMGLPSFVVTFLTVNNDPLDNEIWADLKMHLWNIEAFGHIIASSYSDDKYGIIQRDLATIIGFLLDLYSESDRYARLVTSQRIDQCRKELLDSRLTTLRNRLTAMLVEIHAAFGNLNDVSLTDQHRTLLKRLTDGGNGLRK